MSLHATPFLQFPFSSHPFIMSSEDTPLSGSGSNGTAAPFKVSFGAVGLGKKKAPLVTKTKVTAFGHSEDKDQPAHKDELITGFDGNKIIR